MLILYLFNRTDSVAIMNELRTFRAASVQDALSIIRHEMGADAIIVESRDLPVKRRLLPWLKSRSAVEVTACLRDPAEVDGGAVESFPAVAFDAVACDAVASGDLLASDSSRVPVEGHGCDQVSTVAGESPVAKAVQIAAELERRGCPPPDSPAGNQAGPESGAGVWNSGADAALPDVADANRLIANLAEEFHREADSARPDGMAARERFSPPDGVASRLDVLQKMVENLSRTAHFRGAEEIPPQLFEVYTQLIDADMEGDVARELMCALRDSSSAEQIADPGESLALLSSMIEAEVRCAMPIMPQPGRRKVVALVGPTGVGKTTTIAKLAANFRLRDGIRMGLVTVDTYRIAAVEQLRTYAEIIDLPMKVVTTPLEMRQALDELSGLDLVLIDTAGRSPRDDLKIQELQSLLSEADVDEVHVVMSLTSSVRSISMTCDQFAAVSPTALILTKLDEAPGMGSLLSVARQVALPVSYLTTGQDVPEDIESADPQRVSRLVLGQDRLFD